MTQVKTSFPTSLQRALEYEQSRDQPQDEEGRLRAEARKRYIERLEREKLAHERNLESERRLAEIRLKEEARDRFMKANPTASEADFHSCWMGILDELSRRRSREILEEMRRTAGALRPAHPPA